MNKKLKKFLAMALAATMTFSLAACGGGNSGSDKNGGGNTPAQTNAPSGSSGETSAPSAGDDTNGETGAPSEAVKFDEGTKVIMTFPTWTGAPADTQKVQDAMNEILVEKIGVEVELQISDFASYNQTMTLTLSSGEQVDLASTVGFTYANAVSQSYLTDLEENDLLNTYGKGIIEAMGWDYINACRIGGVLYGVPNNKDIAQGHGCAVVATQYLDGIGYEYDPNAEIIHITLDELNDIYAKLHEKFPDKEVYRPVVGSMQQFTDIDPLGGSVFGVLLNSGKELKVENLFESDTYKAYCERMYDYNQKGYIGKDAATDTTAVGELVKAGTLMSYTTGGKPGIKAQETSLCGQPVVVFQTGDDFISSTSVAGMPWVIPYTTANAPAAMAVLNEFYSDPALADLLAWGIEGTHYVVKEDGLATYPDGVDASNSGWNHSMGWMMPNQLITHVWEGNAPDLWEQMREFNTNAVVSAASGFTFDTAPVANEITAVQNAYDEFQKSVEFGFVDPDTGIQQMVAKMNTAGLGKIIEEKTKQLNEWAAANGK